MHPSKYTFTDARQTKHLLFVSKPLKNHNSSRKRGDKYACNNERNNATKNTYALVAKKGEKL